jgi:hypothetical protein
MRRFLVLLVLLASFIFPFQVKAQTPVDALVNMDKTSPSPAGTQLTSTILNNGTIGGGITWNSSAGNQSAMTVGAYNPLCNLETSISAGGVTYTPATQSQSFAISNSSNFSYWTGVLPSVTKISVGACVTFNGAPYSNLMDKIRIDALSGFAAILQVRNGGDVEIEADQGGGSIIHSNNAVTVTAGTTYWCSLFVDTGAGLAKLACYLPTAPYTQVGTTASVNFSSSLGHITHLLLGNAEVGIGAGTDYYENLMVDATNAVFPLGVASGLNAPWAGILSPGRAIDWSTAGVAGGIPSGAWTQSGSTIAAYSGTAGTINNAIAACGPNQYVMLGAGTFNLTSGIDFAAKSNCVLRGAGADQTILAFSGGVSCGGTGSSVCLRSSDVNWKGGPSNLANWTAGYAPGTTLITLSSVPNLKIGNPIILDQTNSTQDDGSVMVTDSNGTLPFTSPGIAGPYSLQGNNGGAGRPGRQQQQIVTVVGCNGSTTPGFACSGANVVVTISPGLHMPNWAAANSPQAWWATTPGHGEGLENLSVDSTNNSQVVGVGIFNCLNCWVKGIRSIDTAEAHVRLEYAARTTVRDSYFFLTQNHVTSSYGVESYSSSDTLVENNIFHAVASPHISETCSNCVYGYNFTINNYYTGSSLYNQNSRGDHTSGIDFGLYEGNHGNYYDGDVIHGTHNLMTLFRNRLTGPQISCYASGSSYATSAYGSCNNDLQAIRFDSFSRMYSAIGNVLGTTGTNTVYMNGSPTNSVYRIGGGNGSVPSDPNVAATLMLWGNCDSASGFGACRFVSSEVPSALSGTQAPFTNPVPASNALPASFYHASKPSWWPAGKAWPAIGPDVSGGNISGVSGHAYTIPAQDCYLNVMGGLADGTGPVLSFNATRCYGQTSSTGPQPPSNLKATVN